MKKLNTKFIKLSRTTQVVISWSILLTVYFILSAIFPDIVTLSNLFILAMGGSFVVIIGGTYLFIIGIVVFSIVLFIKEFISTMRDRR